MSIIKTVKEIRRKLNLRLDADDEEPKAKKHSALSTRLPYALCKEEGIETEGMSPREAWEAYEGKTGKTANSVKKEKIGGLSADAEKKVSDALRPMSTDYDYSLDEGMDEFIRKNTGNRRNPKALYTLYHDTEDNGGDGIEAVENEYWKTRLNMCTDGLHEISRDEADEILFDNLRHSTVEGWFRAYDHEYKDALTWQMTQSPEVHNAALNIMYGNYKYFCESEKKEPLSYDEFLVTPIKVYRGGNGKEYKKASVFSSYTFDKKVAGSFTGSEVGMGHKPDPNGVIYEAEIRPIDTYGSVYTNGESEILVPRMIAPNGRRDENDVLA